QVTSSRSGGGLNAKCIITTGRSARLAREAEFSRSDQSAIRAEARLRVVDLVQGGFRVLTIAIGVDDPIQRVTLRRDATRGADQAMQLGGPHELAVLRARRRGDRLVDQGASEFVRSGGRPPVSQLGPLLDPGGL